jgi:hypothetical protein
VSHGSTAVSESGELAPNTPRPGSLRPKAKLIGFISKMMITLRMRSLGLHPHARIVVASDLIVVVIADAAWHRPVGPQSCNLAGGFSLVLGKRLGELTAGADADRGEHLPQVVGNGRRADV